MKRQKILIRVLLLAILFLIPISKNFAIQETTENEKVSTYNEFASMPAIIHALQSSCITYTFDQLGWPGGILDDLGIQGPGNIYLTLNLSSVGSDARVVIYTSGNDPRYLTLVVNGNSVSADSIGSNDIEFTVPRSYLFAGSNSFIVSMGVGTDPSPSTITVLGNSYISICPPQDPCSPNPCPDSDCYGNELWKVRCENGNCVRDYIIENCSSRCGCSTSPPSTPPGNTTTTIYKTIIVIVPVILILVFYTQRKKIFKEKTEGEFYVQKKEAILTDESTKEQRDQTAKDAEILTTSLQKKKEEVKEKERKVRKVDASIITKLDNKLRQGEISIKEYLEKQKDLELYHENKLINRLNELLIEGDISIKEYLEKKMDLDGE